MKVKIEAEQIAEDACFGSEDNRGLFLKKATSNRRIRKPLEEESLKATEHETREQASDGLETRFKNQRASRKLEKAHSRKPQSTREKKADYSSLKESLSYEQLVCAVEAFRLLDWDKCDPDKNKNSICSHS